MSAPATTVTESLQAAYDEQYSDAMTVWRELGGKYKAANIQALSRGRSFAKVLECGAGEGSILEFLDDASDIKELHAIEISDSGIAQIRKRVLSKLNGLEKFDGYRIPYGDQAFDMVYCSHVLEHVEHPRLLLRELKRVAKYQILEVPLDYSVGVDERTSYFLAYGHINIYTPSLFKFLLRSEGFEIVDELSTHTDNEVLRHHWYDIQRLPKTFRREMGLRFRRFRLAVRRLKMGRQKFDEFSFNAFTCLTRSDGAIQVFES